MKKEKVLVALLRPVSLTHSELITKEMDFIHGGLIGRMPELATSVGE